MLKILEFARKTWPGTRKGFILGFHPKRKRYRFCESFNVHELVNRIDVTVTLLKKPNLGDSPKIRLETTTYCQYFKNTLW